MVIQKILEIQELTTKQLIREVGQVTEQEAIEALKIINLSRVHPFYDWEEMAEVRDMAIEALKEIQQYRKIGTIEEIRKMINQGINNCYMSHKYEHPGYEEGMCAGLRTMNGDGEPVYKCKLCRLNYLFERSEGE